MLGQLTDSNLKSQFDLLEFLFDTYLQIIYSILLEFVLNLTIFTSNLFTFQ